MLIVCVIVSDNVIVSRTNRDTRKRLIDRGHGYERGERFVYGQWYIPAERWHDVYTKHRNGNTIVSKQGREKTTEKTNKSFDLIMAAQERSVAHIKALEDSLKE